MSKFGDIARHEDVTEFAATYPVMVIAEKPGKPPIVFWLHNVQAVVSHWPPDVWAKWKVISPVEDIE